MKNEFELAFNEIAEARMLDPDVVLEALRTALVSAYRRDANASAAQRVEAKIDPNSGRARIYVEKEVVESVESPNTEVEIEKARYYEPEAQLGDTVMVQVEGTTKKFGRIAAQTAKQVILQKIREAERNALYEEFVMKEGDVMSATVQSVNASFVTVTLSGRAEASLPRQQQIPGERYKPGDKVRVYVMEVKRSNRGPQIVVSRSHRNMLRRLLEFEVPEIYNGQVEIKNIAREAGGRSKVAVAALQDSIDPVGACVGVRGVRIQNIVKELHNEKIDVIEWNVNQEDFIKKALSPARVTGVYLEDDPDTGRTAVVIVPDDQLSLAIGREGQNARLAAKLTAWRIDIKSVSEAVSNALDTINAPSLREIPAKHPVLIEDVRRIMEKKRNALTVMPEEYTTLSKFADVVERQLLLARNEARKARIAELNAVRSTLPRRAFTIPVAELELPDHMIEALQSLENVGEIMLRFLIDEGRLRRMLGAQSDGALMELQAALDKLNIYDEEMLGFDGVEAMQAQPAATLTPDIVPNIDPTTDAHEYDEPKTELPSPAQIAENSAEVEAVPEETVAAFAFPVEEDVDFAEEIRKPRHEERAEDEDDDDEDDDLDELDAGGKKKKGKKGRNQNRQLIFDEELGEMVIKRRRKGGRKRDGWDDFE